MKVKIIRVIDGQVVEAQINQGCDYILPSVTHGWRFNFNKHTKKFGFQTFVLVCEDSLNNIEACLTFHLRNVEEPYMAYIELAPHNLGKNRRYDKVAGCLIAYVCRLSFLHGVGHFKGWLTFDVMEQNKEDEIKLMAMYCQKYGALKWRDTTMVISPEVGEMLIEKFLN
jgi:hypothetical protein